MKVYTPDYIKEISDENKDMQMLARCSLFLAGTIDNGDSSDWQNELIEWLSEYGMPDVTIYNPRRKYWNENASIEEQYNQIDWEQNFLDECDYIIMVLKENSKSPISLMELGQYAQSGKLIVFCNENFYRYQNVKYVCEKESITLKTDLSIEAIGKYIVYLLGVDEIIQNLEL